MSRMEKSLIKKSKKRKLRFISKIAFILCMTFNLLVCIYVVDSSAKSLLGEDNSYKQIDIKEIKVMIDKNMQTINENIAKVIKQFNK